MKIRQLQLKNIGVFDDETIEFKECDFNKGKEVEDRKAEIHILTGENGSGKTTILMALASGFKASYDKKRPSNDFHKRVRNIDDRNLSNLEINLDNGAKIIVFRQTYNTLHVYFGNEFPYDDPIIRAYQKLTEFEFNKDLALQFAIFAFSGYRQIENEPVQANYLPKNFNPLSQSLEFIKDYRKEGQITINQLVANNISNRALSKEDGSLEEAKKYEAVINAIETFVKDVTNYEVKFILKRSPNELKLRIHGEELDFDVLPDGLRSLISWIADLLGRVDLLKWEDDLPITEKNLILLLDEIEVHLHPAWQRKVLPIVQKLFKNAQIFVSTHSPFVVNSVDDAWVYKLKMKDGKAKIESVESSEDGYSYETVLRETFDIDKRFGGKTQETLDKFLKDSRIISQHNGNSRVSKEKFLKEAKILATESAELQSIVFLELAKLTKKTGEKYEI